MDQPLGRMLFTGRKMILNPGEKTGVDISIVEVDLCPCPDRVLLGTSSVNEVAGGFFSPSGTSMVILTPSAQDPAMVDEGLPRER